MGVVVTSDNIVVESSVKVAATSCVVSLGSRSLSKACATDSGIFNLATFLMGTFTNIFFFFGGLTFFRFGTLTISFTFCCTLFGFFAGDLSAALRGEAMRNFIKSLLSAEASVTLDSTDVSFSTLPAVTSTFCASFSFSGSPTGDNVFPFFCF